MTDAAIVISRQVMDIKKTSKSKRKGVPFRTVPFYAKVLLDLPVEGPFDYAVPEDIRTKVEIGKRVWVSFGTRKLIGYIIDITDTTSFKNIKPILEVVDEEPILSREMLKLTKMISEKYLCSWGNAISAAVPSGLKKGRTFIRPRKEDDFSHISPTRNFKPTHQQKNALDKINSSINNKSNDVFLLHGITGSGKTEVYLQVIVNVIKQNRGCIVLVPEISLTPQAVERFKSRFRDEVALFHSRLTQGQKYGEWKKIKEGRCRIVVGARSAIFSPVKDLGLIIVDEEHDTSYKQQDIPRYNAVDAAVMRAALNSACVILGSATPSLESYLNAKEGHYKLIELTERIEKRPLPKVKILDMRHELIERKRKRIIFSRLLMEHMEKTLENGEQVMLFLNRRGFSTYANCKKCGYVVKCPKCNVALNYHSDKKVFLCHYCDFQKEHTNICPSCKESYLDYSGFGTQRVESELHRYFPSIKVSRMDTDSTKKRGSHDDILKDFAERKTKVLVGTQMITKGHDFPMVTLVGVVLADTALNLPDFRAGERTFQLLTQVAGRAGRGSYSGEVVIQTYVPSHYTIQCAINHDYKDFYKKETALRKELNLPPFSSMVCITLRSFKEERALKCAELLAMHLSRKGLPGLIEQTGPCKAVLYKLRRQYRWNIILKAKNIERFSRELKASLKKFKKLHGVTLAVDVDPI